MADLPSGPYSFWTPHKRWPQKPLVMAAVGRDYRPGEGVLFIGEAPGEQEDERGTPFCKTAPAGSTFDMLLRSADLRREDIAITNVFSERPPRNAIPELLWKTVEEKKWLKANPTVAVLPPVTRGNYLQPSKRFHLTRLQREIALLRPRLIVGMGNLPLWALTGLTGISGYRGSFMSYSQPAWECSMIFTLHPAAILRQWKDFPISASDYRKARLWLDGRIAPPMSRELWLDPTFADLDLAYKRLAASGEQIGVDVETAAEQVTMISFCTPAFGVCIPLWNKEAPYDRPELIHYWGDKEPLAWWWIKRFAQLPNTKVLQNGNYDMQYLLDPLDVRLYNVTDDTATLQHASQPELPKKLGTLASLFLNEPCWKYLRTSAKDMEFKDDE